MASTYRCARWNYFIQIELQKEKHGLNTRHCEKYKDEATEENKIVRWNSLLTREVQELDENFEDRNISAASQPWL